MGHIVYLSSHTLYGPHRDNPVPLTDGAPLRPLPGFPHGIDQLRVLDYNPLLQAAGYRFGHTSLEALTAFANSNLLDRAVP